MRYLPHLSLSIRAFWLSTTLPLVTQHSHTACFLSWSSFSLTIQWSYDPFLSLSLSIGLPSWVSLSCSALLFFSLIARLALAHLSHPTTLQNSHTPVVPLCLWPLPVSNNTEMSNLQPLLYTIFGWVYRCSMTEILLYTLRQCIHADLFSLTVSVLPLTSTLRSLVSCQIIWSITAWSIRSSIEHNHQRSVAHALE